MTTRPQGRAQSAKAAAPQQANAAAERPSASSAMIRSGGGRSGAAQLGGGDGSQLISRPLGDGPMSVRWSTYVADHEGVREREFLVSDAGDEIRGVAWLPAEAPCEGLVLFGHGFTTHSVAGTTFRGRSGSRATIASAPRQSMPRVMASERKGAPRRADRRDLSQVLAHQRRLDDRPRADRHRNGTAGASRDRARSSGVLGPIPWYAVRVGVPRHLPDGTGGGVGPLRSGRTANRPLGLAQ